MYNPFFLRHLGAYYMLMASMYFAIMGGFSKLLSDEIPSIEVVFFRNIVGLVLIAIAVKKVTIHQKGGKLGLLIFRGVAGITSMLAFFYNIANMGLAEAFTFGKTAPIFIAIIGSIFLKEYLSFKTWGYILVGFVGILLIMQPNLGITVNDAMGLVNGIFAALAYTSVHELRKNYDTRVIVLAFMIIGTLVPLLLLIIGSVFEIPQHLDFAFAKFVIPSGVSWVFIICMGGAGILYQTYLTKSFAASKKAGTVAVISYSDIIFTLIIGVALGDSLPNLFAAVGIILVIVSGIGVAKEK